MLSINSDSVEIHTFECINNGNFQIIILINNSMINCYGDLLPAP